MDQEQLKDAGLDDLEKQIILWCKGRCNPNVTLAHLYSKWTGCDIEVYDGDLFYTELANLFCKLAELKLVRLNQFFQNMIDFWRPQYELKEKMVKEFIASIMLCRAYNDEYALNLGDVWEEFKKQKSGGNKIE